jgi:glycosyltransferase involved in cell wall biosynthesis
MPTISAIIPAYNEAKTVKQVVEKVLSHPKVTEVICINDGSKDNTAEILHSLGDKITFINLEENMGKGYAMSEGIKISKGELLLFLDSDFLNLTHEHIDQLIDPVIEGKYRVTMGYLPALKDSKYKENWSSDLTGQRVYYKKDLLPHLDKISKTRFGVEIYLNEQFPREEVKKFPLKNLRSLYKHEKFSTKDVFKEYMKEGMEIAKQLGQKDISLKRDLIKVSKSKNVEELEENAKKVKDKTLRNFIQKYFVKSIRSNKEA